MQDGVNHTIFKRWLLQRPQIWQVDIFAPWSVIYKKCCVWQAVITCHGAIKCKSGVPYNSLAFFLDWKLHSHLPLLLFKSRRQGSHSESSGLTRIWQGRIAAYQKTSTEQEQWNYTWFTGQTTDVNCWNLCKPCFCIR